MERDAFLCVAVVAAIVSMATGCDGGHRPMQPHEGSDCRIVSLSPALTRTLLDLDLRKTIVGRTPFCRGVDEVPIVGDLTSVDYERLMQVGATHLLVQPPAGGVDTTLSDAAASAGMTVCDWEINSSDDLMAVIHSLPACLGLDEPLTSRCAAMTASILEVIHREPGPGTVVGPVLIVSPGPSPLGHGEGTYLGELLGFHGEANALDTPGWRQLSIEDIVRLKPRTIIIVNDSIEVRREDLIKAIGAGETPAAEENRIRVLSHPESLRPSPALREVAAELFDHLDALRAAEGS